MILPISVTQYGETWNGLSGGTARFRIGNTTKSTTQNSASIVQPRGPYSALVSMRRHASTALPLRANRPCGRFWMKMMMNTSTAILASTAPDQASSNLLAKPRPSAA